MRIGSLFSGAGGLDMAVEAVFDGRTVWQCEVDSAASKVLEHHWPGVPNLGDITQADWVSIEQVDVLCGGWPCQPFSLAGKRKGIRDDRALWPHVERAIRVLRPRHVCLENVPAVLAAGEFDRVAASLASLGYSFAWTCLRAADVGAPHHRERLFLYATTDTDCDRLETRQSSSRSETQVSIDYSSGASLPDTENYRRQWAGTTRRRRIGPSDGSKPVAWGRYESAVYRWELLTRPAPNPIERTSRGDRLNAAFPEWMMGWPDGWVVGVPGLTRADMFRCIGNGVCPQQAEAAYSRLFTVPFEVAA